MGDDVEQAGGFHARLAVDALQPRRAERPLADRGEDHVGQADVAGIIGRSVDLGGQVEAGEFLAIERVGAARAVDGGGGRFEQRGGGGDLGEAELLPAEGHETVRGVALFPVGVPAPRRRHHQQRARLGRGVAARPLEHAHGRRIGGEHHRMAHRPFAPRPAAHVGDEVGDHRARGEGGAVLVHQQGVGVERADRRGFDGDGAPVGAEFVGDDLRQQSGDALAHLALRDDDADMAVLADLQEGVEDMLALGGGEVGGIVARPHGPGERETPRGGGADE